MLGFHLHITPRFFNFPYTILSTGVPVKEWASLQAVQIVTESSQSLVAFFGLQVMEKYSHNTLPTEAKRSRNSPKMVFRTKSGQSNHTWHVTRINVLFIRSPLEKYARGCDFAVTGYVVSCPLTPH